jgi:hypothetical protein
MNHFSKLTIGMIITTCLSAPAFAAPVSWTDWISSADQFSASGNLLVGSTSVNVGYSGTGAHSFVQTGTGTNYWTGPAYTQGTIDNAPPSSELVALNQGGTVTINFSQTVQDPLIGLVSWNNNTVEFGAPIQFDSFGPGFWGNGTPILNPAETGFFGSGELHGVLRVPGSYDSITFTHSGEFWHGFTVGVSGLASPVPIPATVLLFGSGIIGLLGIRKIGRKNAAKLA